MTAYTEFTPTATQAFQFFATLDGGQYTVIVRWNVAGQRYYVNVYDSTATRVLTLPLVGSPDDYDVSLTAGYFTSTLVYRSSTNSFEVSP